MLGGGDGVEEGRQEKAVSVQEVPPRLGAWPRCPELDSHQSYLSY